MTPKQSKLFEYIKWYWQQKNHAPNYDEMADYMGLKSKSGINRLVMGLKERGYVTTCGACARSVRPINAELEYIKYIGMEFDFERWKNRGDQKPYYKEAS